MTGILIQGCSIDSQDPFSFCQVLLVRGFNALLHSCTPAVLGSISRPCNHRSHISLGYENCLLLCLQSMHQQRARQSLVGCVAASQSRVRRECMLDEEGKPLTSSLQV